MNDDVRQMVFKQQSSELRRYGTVLRSANTPVIGLEVITNNAASIPYWMTLITANGVPGARVVVRP